ncbi:MAG: ADOP family duplicated permease [Terriglobales bacterium]
MLPEWTIAFRLRLRALLRRRRLDRDLDNKLQFHLSMRQQHPNPVRFGNPELTRETSRNLWTFPTLESFGRDLHYALRQMRRNPGFNLIAILILALGLAATASVLSVVDGVLLQPLAYHNPGQLVALELYIPKLASRFPAMPLNAATYFAWTRHAKTMAGISLINEGQTMTLTGAGEPVLLSTDQTTTNLFRVLGVRPQLGAGFQPGATHEVVITARLWRSRFRADPNVIGRAIDLDGSSYTLVGVLPADFHFPTQSELVTVEADTQPAALFIPAVFTREDLLPYSGYGYATLARLRSGVSPAAATAELNAILRRRFPKLTGPYATYATMTPLRRKIVRTARRGLWMLLVADLAVLLIICVNLANLLLTRASAREREAAVRASLGASRARLLRQALTESLLLSLLGGALGLLLAEWALRGLLALVPPGLPRAANVHLNAPVLGFTFAAAVLAGLAAGVLPGLRFQVSGFRFQRGGEGRGGRTTRDLLVGLGTALTTILLIAASLLLTSFNRLAHVPTGFVADHVLTAKLQLSAARYTQAGERRQFWDKLLSAIAALPGVRSVAVTDIPPLSGEQNDDQVNAVGDTRRDTERPWASYRRIRPGFFQTLGIPRLEGRWLAPVDLGTGAAVISQATAQQVWPGLNPIGRRFDVDSHFVGYYVVGVVANTRAKGIVQGMAPVVYTSYLGGLTGSLLLRTPLPAAAIAPELRRAVAALDPSIAVPPLRSLGEIAAASLAPRRFQALLTSLFAAAALLLACLGIYGVVSWSVLRRRREIGVRMALGARSADVLRLLIAQGMKPVLVGLAAGLVAALALMRVLSSLLYGVQPNDPGDFAAASLILSAVALLACYLPARRAARADPLPALRDE